jgi:hypothetical protein
MWPILDYVHFIYVKSYYKVNKYFWKHVFIRGESSILKTFLCFMVIELS